MDNCIICYDEEYVHIKICSNCKFLYCNKCADKLKYKCAICIRDKNKIILDSNDSYINLIDSFTQIYWLIIDYTYLFIFLILLLPMLIYCITYKNKIFNIKTSINK